MIHLPRHAEIWLGGYLSSIRSRRHAPNPQHLWVAVADHFEPYCHNRDDIRALERVRRWYERWPQIARRIADRVGSVPKYTFFYPEEEYRPRLIEPLAAMTELGLADVEVHLHHDREGEQNFVDRMSMFIERLHSTHGLLRRWRGKIGFGFIHGDWCLDNARPDGRFCGLNNELTLLAELGCYADFTLPVTDWSAQTRVINTIYWAEDDPNMPRSHDSGLPVAIHGIPESDSGLLIVPGPFGVRWSGLRPKIDTGELAWHNPPSASRARLWFNMAPRIDEHAFVKLYCHGATEPNADALLGSALEETYTLLASEAASRGARVHFVSTWEMRRAIAACCRGKRSEPGTERPQTSTHV
jgi:hypothetical protein